MNNDFKVIVCGIILNEDSKILLARRRSDLKLGGFWEFPGGKLEYGEELDEALAREIREELNIEVNKIKFFHAKPFQYPHGAVLLLFYLCQHQSGEVKLTDHSEYKWVSASELSEEKNLLPANEDVIKMLKGMYPFLK